MMRLQDVRNLDDLHRLGRPVTVADIRSLPRDVNERVIAEMKARLAAETLQIPSLKEGAWSEASIELVLGMAPGTFATGLEEAGFRLVEVK